MEKHGIGTDATHAEHIETIKERLYVALNPQNYFQPGDLGLGLVEGYEMIGYGMTKPHLRSALEEDLKALASFFLFFLIHKKSKMFLVYVVVFVKVVNAKRTF